MTEHRDMTARSAADLNKAIDSAVRAIPPAWPLAATVAVNPYLGQTGQTLTETSALLARVAGITATMPRDWYRAKIEAGAITDADLQAALEEAPKALRPETVAALKEAATKQPQQRKALATIADLARNVSGIDWPRIIDDSIGRWAAGFFDEGQALWASPKAPNAYLSWRHIATHDLTPEIAGLKGFAAYVAQTPMAATDMITDAATLLGLRDTAPRTYFHQLLMTLGGWAQCGRYRLWQAELSNRTDNSVVDLLAIRLIWEVALFEQYRDDLAEDWADIRETHGAPVVPDDDMVIDTILQTAAERAAQRNLAQQLGAGPGVPRETRPALQAGFCIDVRSEVFRRNLEAVDPSIQTLGFAGFFGVATSHKGFASDVAEHRLPVLLNAGVSSCSSNADNAAADLTARFKARAKRAWGRFKLAAVSSFAFVEAAGPVYGFRIIRDGLRLKPVKVPNGPMPQFDPALPLQARIAAANTVLRAMSLTGNFARLVVLAGHGAGVVNNPHASALQCGACGGYSGEVNARLLAGLLNDPAVRKGLRDHDLIIPEDTIFVGGLHDTTTDRIKLYDTDRPGSSHFSDLQRARDWFAAAGLKTRSERALSLPHGDSGRGIVARARDWSETRPEWGLAGCQAFIAAPRQYTAGKDLAGRSFLHDYDWQADEGFGILELIMTAPVVVASWISLQYYGSTVSPTVFGAGNKLLHNVTGGIGVVEGNGGVLRTGLPMQSVHDGEKFMHDPLRLTVCIRAPREAMTDILSRHEGVRQLFDNKWLTLFALDDDGAMAWRYHSNLKWIKAKL